MDYVNYADFVGSGKAGCASIMVGMYTTENDERNILVEGIDSAKIIMALKNSAFADLEYS